MIAREAIHKKRPSVMENTYLESARDEIHRWENAGPGWISQVSEFMLAPANRAAQRLVPKGVQGAVVKAIETLLGSASWVARHTVPSKGIQRAVGLRLEQNGRKRELSSRLAAADAEARSRWNWHVAYAATEGGATGSAGLLGLAADIPALFTLVLRMIQEIGACYGLDMKKPEEREYVLQVLRTGAAGDLKAKMEALFLLKQVEEISVAVAWNKLGTNLVATHAGNLSLLSGVRDLAKSLGINLTQRKALQMIPVIGGIVGASFNATFANDIGRAAYMSYRRRWIAARLSPSAKGAVMRDGDRSHRPPKRLPGMRQSGNVRTLPSSKRIARAHV